MRPGWTGPLRLRRSAGSALRGSIQGGRGYFFRARRGGVCAGQRLVNPPVAVAVWGWRRKKLGIDGHTAGPGVTSIGVETHRYAPQGGLHANRAQLSCRGRTPVVDQGAVVKVMRRREPVRSGPSSLAGSSGPDRTTTPEHGGPRWRRGRGDRSVVMGWTPYSAVTVRLLTAAVVAAVACGVLAEVELRWGGAGPVVVTPAAAVSPVDPGETTLAADLGVRAVLQWGNASVGSTPGATPAGWGEIGQLPSAPLGVTGARVAQVMAAGVPGRYRVVVSAAVGARPVYYAVTVQVTAGGGQVVGLPAPAPAPALVGVRADGYVPAAVVLSSPLGSSITAFLTAYLGGQDITRFTSPGAVIPTVSAPVTPLSGVTSIDVATGTAEIPAGPPPDGARVAVLVTFAVATPAGPLSSQLPVTVTARGGRWEVTAVAASPRLSSDPLPQPTSSTAR